MCVRVCSSFVSGENEWRKNNGIRTRYLVPPTRIYRRRGTRRRLRKSRILRLRRLVETTRLRTEGTGTANLRQILFYKILYAIKSKTIIYIGEFCSLANGFETKTIILSVRMLISLRWHDTKYENKNNKHQKADHSKTIFTKDHPSSNTQIHQISQHSESIQSSRSI